MDRQPVIYDEYTIRQQAQVRTPLPKATVTLRRPKQLPDPPAKPSLLNMAPMLVMALASGLVGFAFFSSAGGTARALATILPMSMMAMMIGGLQQYNYRQALKMHQAKIETIQKNYRDHLVKLDETLEGYAEQQSAILEQENPPLEELTRRVQTQDKSLWARQLSDDNFLTARIGTAALPICVEIRTPDNDDDDPRLEKGLEMIDRRRLVPDLPVTVNLDDLGSVSVQGRRIESLYLAFTIIANLVVHHSPDVVQLYIISHRPDAAELWGWARWLPHTAALRRDSSRILLHPESDDPVLDELSQLLRQRDERQKDRHSRRHSADPYVVVVFDQAPTLMGHKIVQLLMDHDPSRDHNALRAVGLFIDAPIPQQINAMITSHGDKLTYRETWMSDADQTLVVGRPELTTTRDMERLARMLAPLHTETSLSAGKDALPSNVRLVELLGETDPREVRLEKLYDHKTSQGIRFPIGLSTDLKPLNLELGMDIPHAMLAGTTGKGKSVLLQTMVLSMALSYPPTHVNFVLADFKGGASELAKLRGLPHVVGFVTDLNAPLVERFRIALESEIWRRQELFDKSKETSGMAVANISSYNHLHPDEPLPRLVVVLDEFAYGKQINENLQKAMDQIAARGRALGVHLVLSTQRATDFDQKLRGNIAMRLSLQVANQEESKAIFNRPEAFTELKRPGQARLQIGDNEIWEMFQTGRADIPFYADQTRNVELLDDFAIYRVDSAGRSQLIHRHVSSPNQPVVRSVKSEAEVLVERVIEYCDIHYPPARIICLPPLPTADGLPLLPLLSRLPSYARWDQGIWSVVEPEERLRLPIGLLDLPAQQDQHPYVLNLAERDGNFAVIGPAGSGKLLFFQSLILGLAATHSPDDVHVYILAQNPPLGVFENLPHSGAVIQINDAERVRRLRDFLLACVEHRRRAMREARVHNMAALRAQTETPFPAIVVVFEDYSTFRTEYLNEVETIIKLAASGKAVDIHFVFGGVSMADFKKQLQDNLQNRMALGAVNLYEVHNQKGVPLQDIKGRAYVVVNQEMLECQIAAPTRQRGIRPESAEATEELHKIVRLMSTSWTGEKPIEIRRLPRYLYLGNLWDALYSTRAKERYTVAVGMEYERLELVQIELGGQEQVNFVVGPAKSGKTEYLLTLCLAAAQALSPAELSIIILAFRPNQLHQLKGLPHVQLASNSAEAGELLQGVISDLLLQKQPTYSKRHLLLVMDDAQRIMREDSLPKLIDQCLNHSDEGSITVVLAETGVNLSSIKAQYGLTKLVSTGFKQPCIISFSLESSELQPFGLQFEFKRDFLDVHKPNFGRGRGILIRSTGRHVTQFATVRPPDGDENTYQSNLKTMLEQIVDRWSTVAVEQPMSQEVEHADVAYGE